MRAILCNIPLTPKPSSNFFTGTLRSYPVESSALALPFFVFGMVIVRSFRFRSFATIFPALSFLPFLVSLALGALEACEFFTTLGSGALAGLSLSPRLIDLTFTSILISVMGAACISAVFLMWALFLFSRFRSTLFQEA